MLQEFKNLVQLVTYFDTEEKCEQYIISKRFRNGKFCPHCQTKKVYEYKSGKLFKCGICKKQFTIKVGTIFYRSRIPLKKWFIAIYLVISHKKGISSYQLARDIGVTQKTAWFMLHRIRSVFANQPIEKLKGDVEVDETYVGGKEGNKHKDKKIKNASGTMGKVPIIGMQERKGKVYLQPVQKADSWRVRLAFNKHIEPNIQLYTDESPLYKRYKNRKVVNHTKGQYADGKAHTNTIEGVFSHFKRCIIGIYHHVSVKHISKYIDMFCFRYNTRDLGEGERFNEFLTLIDNKLSYKGLIHG